MAAGREREGVVEDEGLGSGKLGMYQRTQLWDVPLKELFFAPYYRKIASI